MKFQHGSLCKKKTKQKKPTKHSDEKSILNVDTCAAFVMQGGRHV